MTLTKTTTLKLASALAFSFIAFTALGNHASAASFTVNTDTHPSTCTLDEAIGNINDQANTNTDCVPTGPYGTNDTITIPEGTVLLTADLPEINESITIEGKGMGKSVVDADGQWGGVTFDGASSASIHGLTMLDFGGNGAIRSIDVSNTDIDQIEITGPDGNGGILVSTTVQSSASLSNINVHGSTLDNGYFSAILLSNYENGELNFTADNINISNITVPHGGLNGFVAGAGAINPTGDVGGSVAGTVSNLTVADNHLQDDAGHGEGMVPVALVGYSDSDDSITTVDFNNVTIVGNSKNTPALFDLAGIAVGGSSAQSGASAHNTANIRNLVLANNHFDSVSRNCNIFDVTSVFGGTGTPALAINSEGGNLSSDNSCKDYFTKSTDQNKVSALADTLEPLSDNGGFIPTMALKKNSPAIDSGVTVPGLTTDARLAIRPQGNAYDSGAYESPYTQPKAEEPSLAGTGESQKAIIVLTAVTLLIGASFVRLRYMLQ